MRIHYLQHVPFEDMASMEGWALSRGHEVSSTHLYAGDEPPDLHSFDCLVIMGGPMNIYEHDKYPWLVGEKEFIRRAIDADKVALGICLGAQLIADALGGSVTKNDHREIGWHDVRLTPQAKESKIWAALPGKFTAFHWHGDTFTIPPGAARTAESEACRNQAFQRGKAIALQFHLESSRDSINHLIQNCADELTDDIYVQKPKEILSRLDRFPETTGPMNTFLDAVEGEMAI